MGSLKAPVVGTEIKVKVGLAVGNVEWKDLDAAQGHESPFTLEFYTGNGGTVTIHGNAPAALYDQTNPDNNEFTAVVDTETTGPGMLQMRVTLDVYESGMTSLEGSDDESYGYRREVAIYNTGIRIYE